MQNIILCIAISSKTIELKKFSENYLIRICELITLIKKIMTKTRK